MFFEALRSVSKGRRGGRVYTKFRVIRQLASYQCYQALRLNQSTSVINRTLQLKECNKTLALQHFLLDFGHIRLLNSSLLNLFRICQPELGAAAQINPVETAYSDRE